MKKNGKKWRKLEKEKELHNEDIKVGEPFSKAKNKKHLCLHYGGKPRGIVPGYCYSKIRKISENEYACTECGKRFSAKQNEQMNTLVSYLTSKGCCTDTIYIAKLSRGLEPVYYRRLSETEIEIIDTVDNNANKLC